jgi:hypothetical protein
MQNISRTLDNYKYKVMWSNKLQIHEW